MPVVRFARLEGDGEDAVELDRCRRMLVGRALHPQGHSPIPQGPSSINESTPLVFYLTPEFRWVQGMGGMHQLRHGGEGYIELHPVTVARSFLSDGCEIPKELEPFAHAATEGYGDWLERQGPGMVGSKDARDGTLEVYRKQMKALADGDSSPRCPPESPPSHVVLRRALTDLLDHVAAYAGALNSFQGRISSWDVAADNERALACSMRSVMACIRHINEVCQGSEALYIGFEQDRWLKRLRRIIPEQARRWGWESYIDPSSGETLVEDCIRAHERERKIPFLRACLAWRRDTEAEENQTADGYAQIALSKGLQPLDLPLKDAKELTRKLHNEWCNSPALGSALPSPSSDDVRLAEEAFHSLKRGGRKLGGTYPYLGTRQGNGEGTLPQGTGDADTEPELGPNPSKSKEERGRDHPDEPSGAKSAENQREATLANVSTVENGGGGKGASTTDSDRFISFAEAVMVYAVTKGSLTKWANKGRIKDNGKKGRGRMIDAASLTKHLFNRGNGEG